MLTVLRKNLRISTHLVILCLVCLLPMTVIVLYTMMIGINANLDFGQKEIYGVAFQRPLEIILKELATFERAYQSGQNDGLNAARERLDQAFLDLDRVVELHGETLQFTREGLESRQRLAALPVNMAQSWTSLKASVDAKSDGPSLAQARQTLTNAVRLMITHAGDTSNLILDPDLDSYYLMDAVLLALPQTQDRLGNVTDLAAAAGRDGIFDEAERNDLRLQAVLLKEADIIRIQADADTVFNEDANFYGKSPTLQAKLPTVLDEYVQTASAFADAMQSVADGKSDISSENLVELGEKARLASFHLWDVGADELDQLLQTRLAAFERQKWQSVLYTFLALLGASVGAFIICRQLNSSLKHVVDSLSNGTNQVTSGAFQFKTVSESLAKGAQIQAASFEQTCATLTEISIRVDDSVKQAHSAKTLSEESRRHAETGVQDIGEMREAMRKIKDSSDQVAEIVSTIEEIAFQTNLLALNAAVEAARAGHAGQGFAVVADEVRSLAMRSAEAARSTVNKVKDAVNKILNGVTLCEQVSTSFTKILSNARHVDEIMAKFAAVSSGQGESLRQLKMAVANMDQVTTSNASSAEETSAAAQSLLDEVVQMRHAVQNIASMVSQAGHLSDIGTLSGQGEKADVAARLVNERSATLYH